MNPTEKQIEEIADELECGMRCFFNLKTGEIKTILNFDNWIIADKGPWKDDLNEIDENGDDYFEFAGFESFESFQIMEDFAESINDIGMQKKLIDALNKRKPFQHFKRQIEQSDEILPRWFDYKRVRYIQWVKDQIRFNKEIFK